MTPNDAQIDVLLRRFAGPAQAGQATEHLDADELNAFAEGSLPQAARARYVSHLADCDNCRQIVSQLAIDSGAVASAAAVPAGKASGYSWWKRFSGFFSPLTLRYAAFALVLIAATGVIFLVVRRPRETNLVAQNEQPTPASAVKRSEDASPQTGNASPAVGNENKPSVANPTSLASPAADQIARLDQPKTGESAASSVQPAKESDNVTPPPVAGKKAEPALPAAAPGYAPPPPLESQRVETQSREQQNATVLGSPSGPRKSDGSFTMSGRAAEADKDKRAGDDSSRPAVNQAPASRRVNDEKSKGPRRDAENNSAMNRNANEIGSQNVRAPENVTTNGARTEEKQPETRSAGGRKFRRQGNAWVDAKFKPSMTVKSISRGSSEFDQLDSDLRSIAQQLGGEVIIVRKGKAYLIR